MHSTEKMRMNVPRSTSRELMIEFAEITGLLPVGQFPKRYLWTDAFAVCNFLELFCRTGENRYQKLALQLVDQVHTVLGRHREDDGRTGWISGLDEQTCKLHPTRGGLRIGKKLNERQASDHYDEQLEWDRDGQYYHYLTKWMHALSRVSRVTGDTTYVGWAIELAKTVHNRFTYISPVDGKKYMYWKMSIDLSRPLVPAMGQHDPLNGFITYNELQMSATGKRSADLQAEIVDMTGICRGQNWATDDPLGIGGLLSDAYRLAQIIDSGYLEQSDLLEDLLRYSLTGLQSFIKSDSLSLPAEYRLAFREIGLCIGLHGIERLQDLLEKTSRLCNIYPGLPEYLTMLLQYIPLTDLIENFWLEPEHRRTASWTEHRDINMVMLATSLLPDGFLRV